MAHGPAYHEVHQEHLVGSVADLVPLSTGPCRKQHSHRPLDAAGFRTPSQSTKDTTWSSEQLHKPTKRGVTAGLRAQAGDPLGFSWGLLDLNLFWKQRGKKQENCCGANCRSFWAQHIIWGGISDTSTTLESFSLHGATLLTESILSVLPTCPAHMST